MIWTKTDVATASSASIVATAMSMSIISLIRHKSLRNNSFYIINAMQYSLQVTLATHLHAAYIELNTMYAQYIFNTCSKPNNNTVFPSKSVNWLVCNILTQCNLYVLS